jgi:hypothetical protein
MKANFPKILKGQCYEKVLDTVYHSAEWIFVIEYIRDRFSP